MIKDKELFRLSIFTAAQFFIAFIFIRLFTLNEVANYTIIDFIGNLMFYLIIFILPVIFYMIKFLKVDPIDYLNLKNNVGKGLLYGYGVGIVIFIVFLIKNGFALRSDAFSSYRILLVIGTILVGILEEVPMRGFLQRAFKEKLGFVRANIIVSVIFGLLHFSQFSIKGLLMVLFFAVVGLWLGYIYEKTNSLWAPIIVHSAYNLMTVMFLR